MFGAPLWIDALLCPQAEPYYLSKTMPLLGWTLQDNRKTLKRHNILIQGQQSKSERWFFHLFALKILGPTSQEVPIVVSGNRALLSLLLSSGAPRALARENPKCVWRAGEGAVFAETVKCRQWWKQLYVFLWSDWWRSLGTLLKLPVWPAFEEPLIWMHAKGPQLTWKWHSLTLSYVCMIICR